MFSFSFTLFLQKSFFILVQPVAFANRSDYFGICDVKYSGFRNYSGYFEEHSHMHTRTHAHTHTHAHTPQTHTHTHTHKYAPLNPPLTQSGTWRVNDTNDIVIRTELGDLAGHHVLGWACKELGVGDS